MKNIKNFEEFLNEDSDQLGNGQVNEENYKRNNSPFGIKMKAASLVFEILLQKFESLFYHGKSKVVFNKYDGYGLEVQMSGYYRNGKLESDDQYYSYTWYINGGGRAEHNVFEDRGMRHEITNGFWSEDNIRTAEDFANAILDNGKVKGEWL